MLVYEKHEVKGFIEKLAATYSTSREFLLPILQEVQIKYGYISDFAQQEIARILDIHPVEVFGVVTFYSFLSTKVKGNYIIRLCQTISCDMANKKAISDTLVKELGIVFGETSEDKKFTLEYANCMGMCDQGPALLINEKVFTRLTPNKVVDILNNCK